MATGILIFYKSLDGETDWQPVKPEDVPEWIRSDFELLGRMVDGEMVSQESPIIGGDGSPWYRCEHVQQEHEPVPSEQGQEA